MDPQRFIQRPVERGAMVAKLLPRRLLGLGTSEVSRRRVGAFPLLLWARQHRPKQGGPRVTTRPQRHQSGVPTSLRRHP
jgi:hypothetical protein